MALPLAIALPRFALVSDELIGAEAVADHDTAFVRKVYSILFVQIVSIVETTKRISELIVFASCLPSLYPVCSDTAALCLGFRSSEYSYYRNWPCGAHCCSSWVFFVALIGSLVNLGVLYWKRHAHPTNLILLSTFTGFEAFTLGIVVSFYRSDVVLQALYVIM